MTTLDVPADTVLEADRLLSEQKTIAAIKAVRDATRCSLIDARNWVYYRAGGVSGQPPALVTVQCEMTGPHRGTPAPAVMAMQGGTVLCGDCALGMARDAITARRGIQLTPIGDRR